MGGFKQELAKFDLKDSKYMLYTSNEMMAFLVTM